MATTAISEKTKWELDKAHSEIQFKVKHLMISTVTGTFKEYDADIETEGDNFETAKIRFRAKADSVTTGDEARDRHLKNTDFFDAERYGEIVFESKEIKKGEEENIYILNGDLTVRDVTRPIVLKAEYEGSVKDPWGNTKAGFVLTGKLNRKDFGLTWNMLTEAGGMLVSDGVSIQCSVELLKKKEE